MGIWLWDIIYKSPVENLVPQNVSCPCFLENNSKVTVLIEVWRCDVFVKIFLKIVL